MEPLSGTQHRLTAGDYTATIASVGASLRELTWRGRDLVVPFGADEVRPAYRGAVLAPWPNRVVDGRYRFGGVEHELAHTEPDRGHALHGLVAWQNFTPAAEEPSTVTLATTIPAQEGYPFRLDLHVTYALNDEGLEVRLTARNTGPDAAPYGASIHPYLRAGDGSVDDWTLALPAASVLRVTEDRLLPLDVIPVSQQADQFDFRRPRRIGDAFLDHAFTELSPDPDRHFRARVTDARGHGVVMTWGEDCGWLQVHTADLPAPRPSRIGLAVEPMTCPPDAFNSGQDLIVLPAGEETSTGWHLAAC